jgi:hypothetical protein
MAAIAVAVVAVAVGGAFLLRRSKKPKGMYVLCSYFTYGQMHACLDEMSVIRTRSACPEPVGFRLVSVVSEWSCEPANSAHCVYLLDEVSIYPFTVSWMALTVRIYNGQWGLFFCIKLSHLSVADAWRLE